MSTTAQAFLGLTLACARCHDHKFDPIPAEDYYRLVAAFATTERRESPLGRVKRELDVRIKRSKTQLLAEKIAGLDCTSDEVKWLAAGPLPPAESKAAFRKCGKQIEFSESEWREWLDDETRAEIERLEQAAASLEDEGWATKPALFVSDSSSSAEEVACLRRGDVALAEESVDPGFLSVLTGDREFESYKAACRDASLDSTFRRSAVAMWMTDVNDGAGALLARVIVNRIWQHYFGSGLVQTPNDFGLQGDRPTHPELLDWLASQLIRNDWQLKSIHRLI